MVGPFDRLFDGTERALDGIVVAGNRGLQQVSRGLNEAAENLLTKALAALEAGDAQRAEQLIDRACSLAWDDHEEQYPGPETAHQMLYETVADACEVRAASESAWLDAALEVLPTLHPTGREHLATILFGLVRQTDFYDVSAREAQRITRG